jgi:hypothetical protein
MRDLDNDEVLKPSDYGFDIGISLGKTVDPQYGYFQARIVNFQYNYNEVTKLES